MGLQKPTVVDIPYEDFVGKEYNAESVADFLEKALKNKEDFSFIREIQEHIRDFNEDNDTNISITVLIKILRGEPHYAEKISAEKVEALYNYLKKNIRLYFRGKYKSESLHVTLDQEKVQGAIDDFSERTVTALRSEEESIAIERQQRFEKFEQVMLEIATLPPLDELDDQTPELKRLVNKVRSELTKEDRRNFLKFLIGKETMDPRNDPPKMMAKTSMSLEAIKVIWNQDVITRKQAKDLIFGILVFESAPAELIKDLNSEDMVETDILIQRFNGLDEEQREAFRLIYQQVMNGRIFPEKFITTDLDEESAYEVLEDVMDKLLEDRKTQDDIEAEARAAEEAEAKQAAEKAESASAKEAERVAKEAKLTQHASVDGVSELINQNDLNELLDIKEIIMRRLKDPEKENLIGNIRKTFELTNATRITTYVQNKLRVTLNGAQKRSLEAFLSDSSKFPSSKAWDFILEAIIKDNKSLPISEA